MRRNLCLIVVPCTELVREWQDELSASEDSMIVGYSKVLGAQGFGTAKDGFEKLFFGQSRCFGSSAGNRLSTDKMLV